jgi:hypothetical protein
MAYADRDIPLAGAAELGLGDRDIPLDAPVTLPGRLSSALRAVLARGYIPVVTVALPGGTIRGAPVAFSPSDGHYESRLTEMPEVSESGLDRGGTLQALEVPFTWADTDRAIARILEGADADLVAGSAVTYRIAHPKVPPASWRTLFAGILVKAAFPDVALAQLVARTDDLAMVHEAPEPGWRVSRAVWPSCDPDADGKIVPPVYGLQDSQNGTNEGILECRFVDTINNVWAVGAGKVGVSRLYDDDGAIPTTEWTVTQTFRGGRTWTIATFTTPPTGTVMADVVGYDLEDSSGGLVGTNPIDQMAHFFSNFVFGKWTSGPWLPRSGRLDAFSFADIATRLGQIGYRGGVIIADPADGYSWAQKWLGSFYISAAWTPEGTLALLYENPEDLVVYPPGPTLVSRQDAGFAISWDDQDIVGDLVIEYDEALGEAKASLEVMNPKDYSGRAASVSMPCLAVE